MRLAVIPRPHWPYQERLWCQSRQRLTSNERSARQPQGTTISIAAGTYKLTNTLYIKSADVTLRGATNRRDDVILVGKGMTSATDGGVPYGVWTDSPRLTIANLTIRDVFEHAIILNPNADGARVYNVHLINAGAQFIKANPDTRAAELTTAGRVLADRISDDRARRLYERRRRPWRQDGLSGTTCSVTLRRPQARLPGRRSCSGIQEEQRRSKATRSSTASAKSPWGSPIERA